jgi:hypothetical protein
VAAHSDPQSEDTLIGLLLTGDAEVYRYSADLNALDFESPVYRIIYHVLEAFYDAGEVEPVEIFRRLDRFNLVEPSEYGLPLAWFAGLAEKAVARTNAAIDKLENHRVPLTLRESVSILVCKVKLAAAHRQDAMTGNAVFEEIFALDFDRLTTQQMVDAVMQAGGAGAEYLGRFKESARGWVVDCLMEKAERVRVEA